MDILHSLFHQEIILWSSERLNLPVATEAALTIEFVWF